MRFVYFLAYTDVARRGLAFATEVPDDYAPAAGFFLMGSPGEALDDEYGFHAVHGDRILRLVARRHATSPGFFTVIAPSVGRFIFSLETPRALLSYSGTDAELLGLNALRRVRAISPGDLDNAALVHNFYFVGQSPRTRHVD